MNSTMRKAIEAYGGQELWKSARTIQAEVSAHGLLFTLKQRPLFDHAQLSMEVHRPCARLKPIGKDPHTTGVLAKHDVWLEDQQGHIIDERRDARRYFGKLSRLFRWDDLDMAYFANYAFWNYFTFPALLMREDIQWKELKPNYLEAIFPNEIPTHSRVQRFRIDADTGLLIQHDYCADVVSRLANAANVVIDHAQAGDILYAAARAVSPRLPGGHPLHLPTIVAIQVHHLEISR